ncbi:hypothetical protein [Labrys monachus]|uniref:Uncharacterized protein n=1 Tax=Labrys monachus TaxID=217067 RepID=A0ABU0FDK1_9HYPH|nr:hypothetical protein [Labrys monachus]MDQ0392665.1 hypothetical protein [Labrys monachus]
MPDHTAERHASSVEERYGGLRVEMAAISAELIAAGLGMTPGEEIRRLAACSHPLATRYVRALDAFQEVAYERHAPSSGSASMKMMWRGIFDLSGAPARRAKKARRVSALPALSPSAEAMPG